MIPNWNGRRWLPGCLRSLRAQSLAPDELIVVDNGSADDSLAWLASEHPDTQVIAVGYNSGFAAAVNRGIDAARGELVALINTDVELAPDWLRRMVAAVSAQPRAASVACKMVSLADPATLYDAGDILRRDGACEQRGRFERDDGRFNEPGELFGACAGAALYRRDAMLAVGGFDERYFAYLEDVDLALRLRLAGWGCRYEPAVARHAGESSSSRLAGGHQRLVTRNTVLLVVKAFPLGWLPLVVYRQLGWGYHAWRERRLASHLRALSSAVPLLGHALHERRRLRTTAVVSPARAIPQRPIRRRAQRGREGASTAT